MPDVEKRKHRVLRHISGFWSQERNLSVLLGIVIFDFFVLPSFMGVGRGRFLFGLLNNVVMSLLLLTGVFSLTRYKLLQAIIAVIVLLVMAARWGRLLFGGEWLAGWDIFFSLVSSLAFAVVILGHVYREGPMTTHRIQGAVAAYLLLALAFSFAFFLIEFLSPSSFQFHNQAFRLDEESWKIFYYFSICTLTTLGYGDITPMQPFARNLVIVEALVGQLYPAILLARLVSLHTQTRHPKKDE